MLLLQNSNVKISQTSHGKDIADANQQLILTVQRKTIPICPCWSQGSIVLLFPLQIKNSVCLNKMQFKQGVNLAFSKLKSTWQLFLIPLSSYFPRLEL